MPAARFPDGHEAGWVSSDVKLSMECVGGGGWLVGVPITSIGVRFDPRLAEHATAGFRIYAAA